jgi:chromate transporter
LARAASHANIDALKPQHNSAAPSPVPSNKGSRWPEVLIVFLRLGLTSFGGPIAHLAYFRNAFVVHRGWLAEEAYAELVSLAQFLPGPASSQVGIALGYLRAGLPGALAAWVGFTLPSAVLMTVFALGVLHFGVEHAGWLAGLKVFAVAIVAQAVSGMARSLCPDAARRAIAVVVAGFLLLLPWPQAQIALMALAGAAGAIILPPSAPSPRSALNIPVPRRPAALALLAFAVLLVALPLLAHATQIDIVELLAVFYRAGALVFGGGHVVLPLLQAQVVPPGWISNDAFLAGYALAQVVPGPLFTFAAFLGATIPLPGGVTGAAVALVGIFAPAFLLVLGALPFWQGALQRPTLRAAVEGVNAGVVGVLLAALITPVSTSALASVADGVLALAAFGVLWTGRVPVWIVAAACAGAGALLH